jgi:hypothetical protein
MKTSIDGARGASPPFLSGHERGPLEERDAPDEAWALAFAHTLLAELPKLTQPAPAKAEISATPRAFADSQAPPGYSRALHESSEATPASPGKPAAGPGAGPDLPTTLSAEVSDERLGQLRLQIERVEGGLDIVINVADARVKALIEAEQCQLLKTLKQAGLHVTSVQIDGPPKAGTALARERGGAEKVRASASFRQPAARWRTYTGSPAEEEDADGEGVDLTA